jgi:hypothetical protein
MGGTGLEPVTPSLSSWPTVRARSHQCAYTAWLCGITPSSEHSSEPQRTPNLAILATGTAADEPRYRGDRKRPKPRSDRAIANTLLPRPDRTLA